MVGFSKRPNFTAKNNGGTHVKEKRQMVLASDLLLLLLSYLPLFEILHDNYNCDVLCITL